MTRRPNRRRGSAKRKKEYTSPLRDEQAEQTRRRVLDAATRVIARGAAALTIPAVANEAGVAIPTVYRYFSSKEALEDGVARHVREQIGVPFRAEELGLERWLDRTREIWRKAESFDPSIYAVLLASVARELLAPADPQRRARAVKTLATDLAGVVPDDREAFIDVIAALSSTTGAVSFRRLGLDANDGAERLAWLARRLYGTLRRTR